MLYIGNYNYLRRNRTNSTRKDYTISIGYWDIRQLLISRKKERISRKSITLV
jgi:hypothetical protein